MYDDFGLNKYEFGFDKKSNKNQFITDDLWCTYINKNELSLLDIDIEEGEFQINGFIDYFYRDDLEINFIDINHLIIPYIDRGVHNFIGFGLMLKEKFTNLHTLEFSQNWSITRKEDFIKEGIDEECAEDFLVFLKLLELKNLYLCDHQSCFFEHITNNDLFKIMPKYSTYVIICKSEISTICSEIKKSSNSLQELIVYQKN